MFFYNFTNHILTNAQALWGICILLILLGFVVATRLWVLFVYTQDMNQKIKKPLVLGATIRRKQKNAPCRFMIFPRYYALFLFSFPSQYWGLFMTSFLVLILGSLFWFWWQVSIVPFGLVVMLFVSFTIFLGIKKRKIQHKLIEQFPLFLQGMSRSMQAGYTFESALSFVCMEVSDPLRSVLQKLQGQLNYGITLSQALTEMARKINHETIYFFSENTVIQLKTGGNLVEMFQKIGIIINEKLKLDRDIRSFTSQGRLSGVLIAALWPLSLLLFWWIAPEHVGVLFETFAGKILLMTSLFLECLGFYFIWKIVSIKI